MRQIGEHVDVHNVAGVSAGFAVVRNAWQPWLAAGDDTSLYRVELADGQLAILFDSDEGNYLTLAAPRSHALAA